MFRQSFLALVAGCAAFAAPVAAQDGRKAPDYSGGGPVLFLEMPSNLPVWRAEDAMVTYSQAVPVPKPAARLVQTRAINYNYGIADYGPFRVIDDTRIALIGETDRNSPHWFAQIQRDFPGITQLDMVECPGTRDDIANLQLGRMIRDAGLNTYVPAIGSVRSGAVELFLAGARRHIEDGAEFAVHSWRDDQGREADDFALTAPENRKYLDYYRAMGMDEAQARDFYAMTNSVPHYRARWMNAGEMRHWNGFGVGKGLPNFAHAETDLMGVLSQM